MFFFYLFFEKKIYIKKKCVPRDGARVITKKSLCWGKLRIMSYSPNNYIIILFELDLMGIQIGVGYNLSCNKEANPP